jgi:hypothetical protein
VPTKYQLAPQRRCENDDDGNDQPSGEKKKSGVVRVDQRLRWGDHGCEGLGNELQRVLGTL